MPITPWDPIANISNGDPVDAATAGQPHDDLETRTDTLKTFVEGLETDVDQNASDLIPLTDGSNADALHVHATPSIAHSATTGQTTDDHHAEVHTIVSHDTTATGTDLNTLTDGSNADALHTHAVGGGESNTASNLAGDEGLFTTKSGVDLPFKSLSAGTGISLSSDANTVTVSASGGLIGFEEIYNVIISSVDPRATHTSLAAYLADTPTAGDRVFVTEVQGPALGAGYVIPNSISIRFTDGLNGISFNAAGTPITTAITLGYGCALLGNIGCSVQGASGVTTLLKISGSDCYVENISFGMGGNNVTNGVTLDSGVEGTLCKALVRQEGSVLTTPFNNLSGTSSNDVTVRSY